MSILSIDEKNNGCGLESYRERDVELAACQVVWYGVLQVVDVGDPVAAAHVGDAEQVEHVEAYADVLEMTPEIIGTDAVSRRSDKLVLKTDVDAFVRRDSQPSHVASHLRRCHWESVGEDAAQTEFKFGEFWEIVGEKQSDAIALVRRARHFHAVERLLRLHQRETYP